MAKRRMFSSDIVDSDMFLDMPVSARCLYYDLGMRADDDGFISPRKVLRLTSASDDDLRVLISKQFVIPFESGVIVIRDWKLNNYIQKDRYTKTIYKNEMEQLSYDSNGSYVVNTECIQDVSKLDTQVRLGKVRLGKVRDIPKGMDKPVQVDVVSDISTQEEPKEYGSKDLISLKKFLMNNYPKALGNVMDTRKLYNLKQVLSKRKNQDEWLNEDWKKNMETFLMLYLEETPEEYLVNSVDKLREKAKLWREYRGKLN